MMNAESRAYAQHWDEKFRSREWGRYPPEDLVRFIGSHFKYSDRSQIHVLEIGCGPGANLWFLAREGFQVSGIDISPTAIELGYKRLKEEVDTKADLKVGDFSKLPWEDKTFDVIIDNFAVYSNPISVILSTVSEMYRVLKPGGIGFAKYWGCQTTGFGTGVELEPRTFDNIEMGPCVNMGIAHFVDEQELHQIFNLFEELTIDKILRTNIAKGHQIEEFVCQFKRVF